jgi:HD-GYP domain-containing protein (c-di-GMP phosphodiesterase class II)
VAVVLAYQFPIYIWHKTKICVFTVPLFLMAVFLTPVLAATTAGLAILTAEMAVRTQRGNSMHSVATHTGRWIIIMLAGSLVAHIPVPDTAVRVVPLVAAAAVLWLGDFLSLPLVLCPMTGDRPLHVIPMLVREAGVAEAAQYFVGLLGALLAYHQTWALALLVLPTIFVYLAYKKEVDPDTLQLLQTMADAVDLRDPYANGHSRRVEEYTRGILGELGMKLEGQEARFILTAARIHDIGRLGLPDHVVIEDGDLRPEERSLVESCPDRGAELLERYPDFARGIDMVRHHHERWDGTGYPDGLKGAEIPFGARVIAIADSFDAMTSDRSYRRGLSFDQAASVLFGGRGQQWDPDLVDLFLRSIADRLTQPVAPLPLHVVSGHSEAVTA